MGRKAKEGSVNLYYLKNQSQKKEKSVSKNHTSKNVSKSKKTKSNNKQTLDENKFNFDEEIVIGVTKISENKSEKINKVKKKNNKNKVSLKQNKVQAKKKKNNNKEKKKRSFKLFKYVILLSILLATMICFMLSPIFNITEIIISDNNKISTEQIISLSEIIIGENIYRINKKDVINKIKQNPYIEQVSIRRRIPSIIELNIKERQATYMLEYVNSYVYINNQGYMLEISNEKIDKPIIVGISTSSEQIKPGNRLSENDLINLENVLKIMESATSNEIERLITKIDITNLNNYILTLETEGKTVRLGDISDIHTKMLHIKAILEKEAGIEGEIIVDTVSKDSESRFVQKIK